MKIGELIKIERELKFIKAQDVAEKLNVHRNSIYYMEKGEIKISPKNINKLNKLFKCNLNDKLIQINNKELEIKPIARPKNFIKLGQIIKKERISHSLNVSDIATLLEVNISLVYRMEKGERKFQPKHIDKLNKLFNCDFNKKLKK